LGVGGVPKTKAVMIATDAKPVAESPVSRGGLGSRKSSGSRASADLPGRYDSRKCNVAIHAILDILSAPPNSTFCLVDEIWSPLRVRPLFLASGYAACRHNAFAASG